MAFRDLSEFISQAEKFSRLRRVDHADPYLEIGSVTEVAAGLPGMPALLFDNIKGFSRGYRVFTNPLMVPERAALIAARNVCMGRIAVVVDEDIDPSNVNGVLRAIATRCEPAESVDIVRNSWSSPLDPRIRQAGKARGVASNSKMIIDATRPFAWRNEFPVQSALEPDDARAIEEKWLAVLRGSS